MPVVLELMGLMLEPHLLLAAAGPPRGGGGGGGGGPEMCGPSLEHFCHLLEMQGEASS